MQEVILYPDKDVKPIAIGDGYKDFELYDILDSMGLSAGRSWLRFVRTPEADVGMLVLYVSAIKADTIIGSVICPAGKIDEDVARHYSLAPVEKAIIRYYDGENFPVYVSCGHLDIKPSNIFSPDTSELLQKSIVKGIDCFL